ncbi:MAG: HD domain-containing protein [Nitrospiraceae bacterium]|nr:HD domain-containing protein [Nitrospiraceae bacterium]
MNEKILFVDDEVNNLECWKRLFSDSFPTLTASNPVDALDIMKDNRVSVIVSDYKMPQMNGIELLQRAKRLYPETVRVLITACNEMKIAVDAINEGEVYKFVTKPWDDRELKSVVVDSFNRHRLIQQMRAAEDSTLLTIAQAVELKDHSTKGHCDRVARYAIELAAAAGVNRQMLRQIRVGAWLHDCGKIGIPDSILNKEGPLSLEQFEIIKNHCVWGADVARLAGLPEVVIDIILHHHERYDGKGYPFGLKGEDIPMEARIVSIADIYDALTTDRPYRGKYTREKALEILEGSKGSALDASLVDKFPALARTF